ncbi:hypothetical protein N0V85_002119 [Neurospora sp. IMI 360204]|nr:hypothetical protein N0V85_002119 [Neurospora sp. IMI 360204]
MAPVPSTPRRRPQSRPKARSRAGGSATTSRSKRHASGAPATEPPLKKRRYVPGGPGGGGRFIDEDGVETPAEPSGSASRVRTSAAHASPSVFPKRERSTRIRTAVNRDKLDDMQYSSAAAVVAAVVQSEGYKPREERGWEEFHPNLDIEGTFMVFQADQVDGILREAPPTPAVQQQQLGGQENGATTPTKSTNNNIASTDAPNATPSGQDRPLLVGSVTDTPSRRGPLRPTRESSSLYANRPLDFGITPKTPKVLPIHNQTPKERLDLKQPSYRKTDRIALFESKTFGQARYVDKSMSNVGYQESDNFIRSDRKLIKATDANVEEDIDPSTITQPNGESTHTSAGAVGRVEYDMDEQDDMWLETLNRRRKDSNLDTITREIFEITITKIEKEWHALEKRIPKPNPKPPQTHRPRSSSAAAVNGEPQTGEEQDSKCAICDDGDCENTNAIVFCDGCDLAVHQECYGVPFIPEGQWLCRKCQLIGRGIPTCIFCPNTDGAFKQTNSSKWAHLLCAMWIPEVSLGNHTFMEPVMEVEKVPKNRWKLVCYICNQKMGACIQCSNKNCFQAFHVTCARRSRLYLKMKNSQGALAVLEGGLPLKAYCDKHCPQDYAKENDVVQATKDAKRFYKRAMKGRIWADSQASALQLAATHRHAITEHPPDESQMTGAKVSAVLGENRNGQPGKPIWKLPSGAPIIPQAVYDLVESALARFTILKRKDFVAEACRYWTLKREARRGAALLKRLQLQMETFSSMELTRRNFAAMGPSGKTRLARRIEFARTLLKDLEHLKALSEEIVQREASKLEAAEMERDFVDSCYFPVHEMLIPVLQKAVQSDRDVFAKGLSELQDKMGKRYYTTTLQFTHDLCRVISAEINSAMNPHSGLDPDVEPSHASPTKHGANAEVKKRKQMGKRILKQVQPYLEAALQAEADICSKPYDALHQELEGMLDASLEVRQPTITVSSHDDVAAEDVEMTDAPEEGGQIIVADQSDGEADGEGDGDADDKVDAGANADDEPDEMNVDTSQTKADVGSIEVNTSSVDDAPKTNGTLSANQSVTGGEEKENHKHDPQQLQLPDGPTKDSGTPPSLPGEGPDHAANVPQLSHPQQQSGPLTPPQSNGSFGRDPTSNILTEGGVPTYLHGFQIEGTSVIEEQWPGREAVRSLSEELTDMDDEALKDLEFDVDEADTITATPPNPVSVPLLPEEVAVEGGASSSKDAAVATVAVAAAAAATLSAPSMTTRRRERANPARARKGVRTSARRR